MKTKEKFFLQDAFFKSYNHETYKNIGKTPFNPKYSKIPKTNEFLRSREYVKADYLNERDRPVSSQSKNPIHYQNLGEVSRKPLANKFYGFSAKNNNPMMGFTGQNAPVKVEYLQTEPEFKSFQDNCMFMSYDFTQGKLKNNPRLKLDLSRKLIHR